MIFCALLFIAITISLLGWLVLQGLSKAAANYQRQFKDTAQVQLAEAFLFFDPKQLWSVAVLLAVLMTLSTWLVLASTYIALLMGGLSLFVPKFLFSYLRKRRLRKFEQQIPDFLLALAGALRAGVNLQTAMQQLSREQPIPMSQELSLMMREQRLGRPFHVCLDALAARMPLESCILTVSALKIGTQTGGSLAQAIEQISHTVRARLQLQGRIKALTSQGKMQAWVMGLLPPCLMLVLSSLEPDSMYYFWHSPMGWLVLLIIVSLECFGVWLIKRIVAIDI
ncbi:type II secretion system F family protein [Brackiella oedipodis]|uniref:type II secretion system F family protein n=1 Tax=Brackiella oedipodis TaxID=124225 RepID=UPI00048B94E4|nr:type II secretion system F family protein [Brackiella oedipodis]